MTIQLAELIQLGEIIELYEACKVEMIQNEIYQWNEHYPNSTVSKMDILNEELYTIEENNQILGVVALNDVQDKVYANVNWKHNHSRVLVIHRLAIHPKSQGKGIAKKLMDFSEQFAVQNNFESIRLDAFSENPIALSIYEKRNYIKRGTVYFPYRDIPFHCFEKSLI